MMGSGGQYAAMVPTAPSATTFTGHLAHWAASVVGRKVGVCARGEEWEVRPRTSAFADASSTPCRAPLQVLHPLGYLLGVPVSLKPSLVVIKVANTRLPHVAAPPTSSQEACPLSRVLVSLSALPSALGSSLELCTRSAPAHRHSRLGQRGEPRFGTIELRRASDGGLSGGGPRRVLSCLMAESAMAGTPPWGRPAGTAPDTAPTSAPPLFGSSPAVPLPPAPPPPPSAAPPPRSRAGGRGGRRPSLHRSPRAHVRWAAYASHTIS